MRTCIVLLILGILLYSSSIINAYKHHLEIKDDERKMFSIEGFGFGENGKLKIQISDWVVDKKPNTNNSSMDDVGFFLFISGQESSPVFEGDSSSKCELIDKDPNLVFRASDFNSKGVKEITIQSDVAGEVTYPPGYYTLYYKNCKTTKSKTSFKLVLDELNYVGSQISYLPIGNEPLPTLYGVFSIVFFGLALFWVMVFLKGSGKRVNLIHHLCTAYLIIQGVELLFSSIEQHYIKSIGSPNGWNVLYYIFAFTQASFFIILLTMIGSGYHFIKPFFSDRDKLLLSIVVPLQILDNIALIIIDEEQQGTSGWTSWRSIFILFDAFCCLIILFAIYLSLSQLENTVQGNLSHKVLKDVQKYRLFRYFYNIVVTYLYFTRIIMLLLKSSLPFTITWVGEFILLVASFIFYCIIGYVLNFRYLFRPTIDNPYFHIPTEEEAEEILAQLQDQSA
ncbi:hypothetical protein DICPUDRAFT_160299 [Dictyostelium purpureum]|uniref:Intimal thickness related receptor IRP domain-containing protein n=1 Tax=Dictyostelium purpureum TaxID=5786 RepID=F1A637_DICPU|nr:uncharacterized protein DICPUDRAFT_160299 [Dictyostelium purpureum]EGC28343.1 hypothetical protein DICPUDRAFT_160299 [Dictyostelium purpureum]|eukprot:XP_003295131.1 hypothetical protein DICPUDRAFT_160299 [Dictyostelium purpureum]